jgi:hypothetical protein
MPGPDRPDEGPDFVNRRRLLRLAGSISFASMVSACSSKARMDPVSASATAPRPPSTPNPVVTSAKTTVDFGQARVFLLHNVFRRSHRTLTGGIVDATACRA